jgi:hypothetical protein
VGIKAPTTAPIVATLYVDVAERVFEVMDVARDGDITFRYIDGAGETKQ